MKEPAKISVHDCECGFSYCPHLASDRRAHDKHHAAAFAARERLRGVATGQ
jgi:hypothetical protein